MIRAEVESRVWLHSPPLTLKADFVLISPTVLDFNSRPRGGASGHTEICVIRPQATHRDVLGAARGRERRRREATRF